MTQEARITALAQAVGADIKALQLGGGGGGLVISGDKAVPHDNDPVLLQDSQDGFSFKRLTWQNLRTAVLALLRGEVRERLTADRDYYVRKDGSDSNDGHSDAAGGAFLTIGRAVAEIRSRLDLNGYTSTIHVGAGEYDENVSLVHIPRGTVRLVGSTAAVLNPPSGQCIYTENAVAVVEGFTFGGHGGAYSALYAGSQSALHAGGGHVFKRTTWFSIIAVRGASFVLSGNYTIDGTGISGSTAYAHIGVYDGAAVVMNLHTCTLVAQPHFTTFIDCGRSSAVNAGDAASISYVGAARSGTRRYNVYSASAIWSNGKIFPGSVAGQATAGGAYS